MIGDRARLQFRWEQAPNGTSISGGQSWFCHYELVLPLREHDIRREDDDGNDVRSELVIPIKGPTIRGSTRKPCWNDEDNTYEFDAPFRDGAHAAWDAPLLGDIPVVCIAPDGTVINAPPKVKP
jgi:hypothetical protein